jgi:hypothetical protein
MLADVSVTPKSGRAMDIGGCLKSARTGFSKNPRRDVIMRRKIAENLNLEEYKLRSG